MRPMQKRNRETTLPATGTRRPDPSAPHPPADDGAEFLVVIDEAAERGDLLPALVRLLRAIVRRERGGV
jgi:hypothetical protein